MSESARENARKENMDTDRLNRILNKQGHPYVFALTDDEKTAVMEYGEPSDILYLLHSLYHNVREELVKRYGERIANKMMQAVSMTDEEIRDDLKKTKQEIPAWLKRLMEIDIDEDDISYDDEDEGDDDDDLSAFETDDEETGDEDEEDKPTTYHFRGNGLHLSLRIDSDDAVRGDDER